MLHVTRKINLCVRLCIFVLGYLSRCLRWPDPWEHPHMWAGVRRRQSPVILVEGCEIRQAWGELADLVKIRCTRGPKRMISHWVQLYFRWGKNSRVKPGTGIYYWGQAWVEYIQVSLSTYPIYPLATWLMLRLGELHPTYPTWSNSDSSGTSLPLASSNNQRPHTCLNINIFHVPKGPLKLNRIKIFIIQSRPLLPFFRCWKRVVSAILCWSGLLFPRKGAETRKTPHTRGKKKPHGKKENPHISKD